MRDKRATDVASPSIQASKLPFGISPFGPAGLYRAHPLRFCRFPVITAIGVWAGRF